jgi:undecaprenyl-diphosphatase
VGLLVIAIVLGIVEGLTEFLPVSSTGHLIVVGKLFGLDGEKDHAFEIFIQLGAVLAVVWDFRRPLAETAGGLRADPKARRFVASVAIAFVPAAVVGLLAHNWIERTLFSPRAVAMALLVGGVVILWVEMWLRRRPAFACDDARAVPIRMALVVGLAQLLSLYPGVSRSAATIVGGLLVGMSRPAATEFSFYLAIPTLGAATVYSLLKVRHSLSPSDYFWYGTGLVVSFVTALIVIRVFLAWVRSRDFRPFAWYRIAFGLLVLALSSK